MLMRDRSSSVIVPPSHPPPNSSHPHPRFSDLTAPKRAIHPSPPFERDIPAVCATGGGAFKFEKMFRDALGIELHKEDELKALVKGIDFMIHTCPNECYYLSAYRFRCPLEKTSYSSRDISYPYLVVNIGSGVSIMKVTGPSSFERVGGTSLGGGTFYGLCRALTGCTSFEEALRLAELGRHGVADLLVGDIYGSEGYEGIGLPANTVAASFGKLVRGDALNEVRREDLAKAALVMITNNIGEWM
jgi:type II pantothenate kinase